MRTYDTTKDKRWRKEKRSLTVSSEAHNMYKKEIQSRKKQGIGQAIAEMALELEPEESTTRNHKTIQFRIDEKTWKALKDKAKKENTSISRLIERTLWYRSE